MTLDLFARAHAAPGNRAAVLEAIHTVRTPTREEPGCLRYDLHQSVRDPDEFVIHTRWLDLASFERHAELPHTVRFLERMDALLDEPLRISLAEPLP